MSYKTPKLVGDVTGDPTATKVAGLLNQTLPSISDGYLNWNGSSWQFSSVSGGGSDFVAGGDLTGTSSSQTVAKIQGNAISLGSLSAADDGYTLTWVNASSQFEVKPSAISSGFGPYSERGSAGNTGRTYIASDGIVSFVDDGYEWRPLIQGVPGFEAAPNNSITSYTQVGLSPTKSNAKSGCIFLQANNANANSLCGYEITKDDGYTLIAHILPVQYPQATIDGYFGLSGIWVRDTSSGKVEGIFLGKTSADDNYNYIKVYTYSTLSSFNTDLEVGGAVLPFSHGIWLRIDDTGTDNLFSWSFDGQNWIQVGSDNYVPSLGNKYGFGVVPNGLSAAMTVQSFRSAKVTPPPTVSLVAPLFASSAGGWNLTITGTGLTGTTSVSIGGQAATSIVVVSDTELTCVSPAWTTPNGTDTAQGISATNAAGSGTLHSSFYFLPSNNPIAICNSADAGITKAGSNISQWNDLSGNGNHWTVPGGSTAPTFNPAGMGTNSLPAVSFDGVANAMSQTFHTPFGSNTPTFYLAFQNLDTNPTNEAYWWGVISTTTPNFGQAGLYVPLGVNSFYTSDIGALSVSYGPVDTNAHCHTIHNNSSNGNVVVSSAQLDNQTPGTGSMANWHGADYGSLGDLCTASKGLAGTPAPSNMALLLVYIGSNSGGDDTTVQSIIKQVYGTP